MAEKCFLCLQRAAEKVKQSTKLSEAKPKSSGGWLVSHTIFVRLQ